MDGLRLSLPIDSAATRNVCMQGASAPQSSATCTLPSPLSSRGRKPVEGILRSSRKAATWSSQGPLPTLLGHQSSARDVISPKGADSCERVLSLANCDLDPDSARILANQLTCTSRLRQVDFSGNDRLGQEGVRILVMELFPRILVLTHLKLCDCGLRTPGICALAPGVGRMLQLTDLDLSGNLGVGSQEGAYALATAGLSKLTQLRELGLSRCAIGARSLAELSSVLSTLGLTTLRLSDSPAVAMKEGAAALAGVFLPELQMLRSLHLAHCNLGGGCIAMLADGLASLTSLEALDLEGNPNLGRASVAETLADKALPHLMNLRVLVLRYCGLNHAAFEALGPGLCQTRLLKELHLGENRGIGSDGDSPFRVECLHRMRALKVVDLSYCALQASQAAPLAQWVKRLDALERLRLDNNPLLLAEGALRIAADALKGLRQLHEVDLSNCGVGNEAVESIQNMVLSKCVVKVQQPASLQCPFQRRHRQAATLDKNASHALANKFSSSTLARLKLLSAVRKVAERNKVQRLLGTQCIEEESSGTSSDSSSESD